MAKVVLEVKGNPKSNDVLVYDDTTQSWKAISKSLFLGAINKRCNDLEKENSRLKSYIDEVNQRVSTLAKIMKEGINK